MFFSSSKTRDVRIIIANFNQTIATHMFCHVYFINFNKIFISISEIQAAREQVYGYRYQWIILGYPSSLAWWYEPTDCSMQELIRAINGTLQTRVPRLSIDDNEVKRSIERKRKFF